jgi:hypothetical protein
VKKITLVSIVFLLGLIVLFTITGYNFETKRGKKTSSHLLPEPVYSYWKNNMAEISSFELKQVRYGEIREGKAVLIFVTEPFLPKTQVKYDGKETVEEYAEVLKLNLERTFNTGIYPYSLLTSVFTPFTTNPEHPYKITTSSQDWCGQSFFQLNNRDDSFEVNSYSYFQEFGDEKINLSKAYLEDELWNKIRLDLNSLPLGEIDIIPSTQYLRFVHLEPKALSAKAELISITIDKTEKEIYSYNINYSDHARTLEIFFEKELPHKIVGWKEIYYPLLFNGEKKLMTTEATLIKSINLDYWKKNSNADSVYRKELGL